MYIYLTESLKKGFTPLWCHWTCPNLATYLDESPRFLRFSHEGGKFGNWPWVFIKYVDHLLDITLLIYKYMYVNIYIYIIVLGVYKKNIYLYIYIYIIYIWVLKMGDPQVTMVVPILSNGLMTWMIWGGRYHHFRKPYNIYIYDHIKTASRFVASPTNLIPIFNRFTQFCLIPATSIACHSDSTPYTLDSW